MFLAAVLVVGLFTGEGDYCLQIFFKAANDCERSSCALKVLSVTLKMCENLTVALSNSFLTAVVLCGLFGGSNFVLTAVLLCAVYGAVTVVFVRVQLKLQFRVRGLLEDKSKIYLRCSEDSDFFYIFLAFCPTRECY